MHQQPATSYPSPVANFAFGSGLMAGLGETDDEILDVMRDLRAHDVDMLTIC